MPTSKPSLLPFWQTSGRLANIRLPWLFFTLLVFAGLIKLGLWQTERANEKEQRLARIATLQAQQGINLTELLALQNVKAQAPLTKALIEEFNDFPLRLSGHFDPEAIFLLDNQVNKGQLGYRVLQVFYSQTHAVLVNLGWVKGFVNRNKLPSVEVLQGSFHFSGHVRYLDPGFLLMAQDFNEYSWPLRIQQIELEKMSQLVQQPLLPFVVYLDKQESIGYEKNWQAIVMPPEKHRGYAFQWFSLATAWLLLMCWVSGLFKNQVKTCHQTGQFSVNVRNKNNKVT